MNHEEMTERVKMDEMERHVPAPDELAEAKELQERVRNAINDLPEQERLVVTLYYMDGLTQHDIADFVGVSESTVKRRLHSSRNILKGELLTMIQEDLHKQGLTEEFTDKVAFKIDSLEKVIRDSIGKPEGSILKSDLEELTKLEAKKKGITELDGIEHCGNLQRLYLWDNQINSILDLTLLSNLNNLVELFLKDNRINDLSPLSNLTKLEGLGLGSNQIENIRPLSTLITLRNLYLSDNQIEDISPLIKLTNLQTLRFEFQPN